MSNISVWLAYVSLPYTTAAYYERALRRKCQTLTIGPKPTEDLILQWNLDSIRVRIKSHNLETSYQPDMAEIYKQYSNVIKPSLYLWIESAGGYFPKNLDAIKCPKACIFIDSHVNLDYQIEWAKNFDFIFVAQLAYVPVFKNKGLNAFWLPLAADSEIHSRSNSPEIHDVSMVGSIFPQTRRFELIEKIKAQFNFYTERCFLEDMSRVYSSSKIVFNNAIKDDLNMRVFEAMATGSLLLTDSAKGSGQDELFRNDEDYVLYQDDNILQRIECYLTDSSKRKEVALRGKKLIHAAHLYTHRVNDLLNVVLGKKTETFSPIQLRELSLGNKSPISDGLEELFSPQEVSYVIPVLDYSPASPFNIKTLLSDLADVPGDVIVVFNNEEVANELKHHPRITEYSILKNNVGVSRAWNIGLNISRTPYTFILNSDLKISLVAITQLLGQIKTLDRAAIVGPQGAFFDFESMKDYYFFDKGSFNKTIQVDAVSGFFFVVNNKLFNENGLAFDNRFTPCYREEWDIGLQIKSANLCCYIAPVTDYDHQWSGSIRAYKKIRYYDQEQTPKEILERTGRDFQQKWREIAKTKNTEFLHSGWKLFALNMTEIFLKNNQPEQAVKIINLLSTQFLNDYEILAEQGLVAYHQGQIEAALDFYKKSISIKPDYQVALKNIQLINSIHSSEFIDKLTNTKNKLLTKEIRNPYFEKDHQIICRSFNEIKKTINPDILVKWLSDNLENIANGVNSINAYQMLRAISIESRFGFNRAAKKFYRNMFPSTLPISENSQRIASSLEHNGYYVFRPTKSSIKFAKDMKECLSYLRVTREKDGAVGELSNFLNNPIPGSFRYIFFEEDLPVSPVLNLLYESGVLRGVSDYIGHPILRNINAWVSTCPNNYDNHDVSRSAQAYHFDNDNPTGWTKVFIYLTDVDEDTGPHVYVPNSHLLLPEKLKRDGRFTDDEIHNGIAFGEKLIGDAGTIIIADTLGMHKGMQVKKGIRIIFQLEFVTSLIGEETSLNINSEKIIHELPSFMDERLSYRYIRDSKILSSRKC